MRLLVKKEFSFTALPLCYLFLGFSLLTLVPGYPIAVGSFFLCLGLFQSLLSRREQGDLSYTLLLPVSKREIVKANYLFTVLLQLAYLLLCALLTALRVLCFSGAPVYLQNPMMNANPGYLGYLLLVFLLFNLLVLGGYWKTGYELGKPFVFFSICAFLVITLGETLHHLPGLTHLNAPTGGVSILALGIVLYPIGTWLGLSASQRKFEQVDL